ncbi:MAG TPA: toprim domain-containing protein, partial [Candidatus Dojkabacteria bacterium]|nr:toprim domain-containing protein [Candidatus Dojkabacteria bacterium]
MNLVLVESPAKAKTIEKYLGKEYKVKATIGHIIDLPKSKLSVDVDDDYKPAFVVMEGKTKIINEIKKLLPKKDHGEVFLAMDPDREGEAIAFHTAQALKLKNPK